MGTVVFFGHSFDPFSTFCTLFCTNPALILQTKTKTLLRAPCASFLEHCSCCLQHFLLDSLGFSEHECSKPRKTPRNTKIKAFQEVISFSPKNTSQGVVTSSKKVTDLHQHVPIKKGAFSKFSPIMSRLSDISGHRGCIFATFFFSTCRPDRDPRSRPSALSTLALAIHRKPCL